MTQEQRIRRMLEGFVNDPADTPSQEGFLAAVCMIAVEVMGFDWNDPLVTKAQASVAGPETEQTVAKARPTLTVIK